MADKDDNSTTLSDTNSFSPSVTFPLDRENKTKKIREFESLISGFSATLIDTPEENLEHELYNWLKKFVEFLEVDRCVVNEFMDDGKTAHHLLNYTIPDVDITPVPDSFQPPEGVIRELEKGIIIRAEKIPDDLPQTFRGGIIEKTHTKSIVIVPFSANNRMIGTLLFASFRKERKWSDAIIRRIKLIGEIIANAIIRLRSQKKILEEVGRREALEQTYSSVIKNANLGFMIINLLEHSIIDVNDEYCRMTGYSREELINKKTWEIDASMDPEKIEREKNIAIEKGSVHIFTAHRRKDGTIFDTEVSSTIFANKNIVYSFIRDITELTQARKELEERLEFEELVSEFSATLIDIKSENINKELNHWLERLVKLLKLDRGVITEYLPDQNMIRILLHYTAKGEVLAPLEEFYEIPETWMKEYAKGEIIRADRIHEGLPSMILEWTQRDNIRSFIIVPLKIGDQVLGNITLASHTHERIWPDDLIMRIRLIGEIIANAILRVRSQKELLEEVERRQMLEEKYSNILKNASVGFWISNFGKASIIYVNDEYCRMSGYSREELLSKKIWEIDAFLDQEKVRKEGLALDRSGISHHVTRHIRKDGTLFDVDVSSNLYEKEGIVCSFMRDITDLNLARRDLEERLKFEELIAEFSSALISIESFQNELVDWLKKFVEFIGVDRAVVIEHNTESRTVKVLMQYSVPEVDIAPLDETYVIPEDEIKEFERGMFLRAERIPEDLPEMLRGGLIEQDNTRSVIIVPLLAGSRAIGSLTFATYREEHEWSDDMVRRIRLIGETIASAILRSRSRNALIEEIKLRKRLEEKYSSILKNASVGFWITDFSTLSILDVNDEYCRMSGYSREELLSKKIWEIDASEDPDKVKEERASMVDQKGIIHLETRHLRKDGNTIDVAVSANVFKEEGIVCNFIRDVTDLKNAQKELEERLEFEELVSEFSAELVNIAPEHIYDVLNKWLKKFVEFLKVDRGIVNEHLYEENMIHLLLNYTVPEIDIPLTHYHQTPPGIRNVFIKGLSIKAEKIPDDLPEGLRGGLVEKENTKSVIIVPIIAGNEIIGNLTFLNYLNERKWPDDLVRRLKLIGEIIGNAILRKHSHDTLFKEMEQRERLEERYSLIVRNANVGFWISDIKQNILDVNNEYCRMSGYSRDEVLLLKVPEIDITFYDDDAHISEEILGVGAVHHEVIHKRKDGSFMDVDVSSTLNKNEGILYSFMRDITEEKQVRKEREERLAFEELISEFSAALMNMEIKDIYKELEKWFEKFVHLMDADRCAVNEYGDNYKIIKNLMQYSVPEINIHVPDSRMTPEGEISLLEKGIIRVEKTPEDIPPMFSGSFIEKSNAKSFVIVPLLTGNRIFGNLAITFYRKEHRWSDEYIRKIRLIAEIVGNAILRMRSHEALLEEMKQRQMIEERYSSIIKTANVGFWISDINQNILVVNDEYCRMSGYSRDELTRMKISDIDSSKDPEQVEMDGADSISLGSSHKEKKHIRKDGTIFDVEISTNFLPDEGLFFCFTRDITDLNNAKRELEERLKFEELVSEFSAILINVKIEDVEKELELWFKRFAQLMDVDRCAIGQYEKDLSVYKFICTYINPGLDPEPPAFSEVIINARRYGLEKFLMNGEYIKFDSINETLPDDLRLWEQKVRDEGTRSILMLPLIAGDTLIGSMVFASLTHEKRWTDELIRRLKLVAEIFANYLMRERIDAELDNYRESLEEMVKERTVRLEEAQRELVLNEKMATLGRLTATVSHELRNPLGTIRTSVFSIGKRIKGHDNKVMIALERAERNIRRCDLIIDELLNYSRIKELILEPTSLDDWIKEVLEETKPPFGITVKTELNAGVIINIDKERFRRSMINILTNAYQAIEEKASDEPGIVIILTRKELNKIIIEISDNGIGFDMAIKSRLFEPLFSTKAFGVGLGIPITSQIIEQHGFQMDMLGEPQKGASVTITIPVIDKVINNN